MVSSGERQVFYFVVLLALLGAGVRSVGVSRFERTALSVVRADGRVEAQAVSGAARALAAQRAAVDSAAAVAAARKAAAAARKAAARSVQSKAQASAQSGGQPKAEPTAQRKAQAKVQAREQHRQETRFPIDVNLATEAELQALPRVGPAMARRIIEYRETVGRFRSLEDLRHVRGIGPATLRVLDPLVTFSGWPSPIQSGKASLSAYRPAYLS